MSELLGNALGHGSVLEQFKLIPEIRLKHNVLDMTALVEALDPMRDAVQAWFALKQIHHGH
ncbi:hypothetical protein Bhyg_02271 [Pseudolycoriella hygida]|uniref:Uncharacterized protein n=1 Tax=Pseudolycoriella hygida TaxID=35572 RepID=A0A9Q0NBJ5_9DIPT|nr:hypothetical protein Bhyg_02271 [Pseudolycoriella hygida]